MTSAFLGGVVMFIATFFREKLEVYSKVVVTPPPVQRETIGHSCSAQLT
jgi:hypothetical protein